jgi:hypothetical protein
MLPACGVPPRGSASVPLTNSRTLEACIPMRFSRNVSVTKLCRLQAALPTFHHSCRSATIGSTLVARRAGSQQANSATTVNNEVTATKVHGSF